MSDARTSDAQAPALVAWLKDEKRVAQFKWEIGKCLQLGEPNFTSDDVEKMMALAEDREAQLADVTEHLAAHVEALKVAANLREAAESQLRAATLVVAELEQIISAGSGREGDLRRELARSTVVVAQVRALRDEMLTADPLSRGYWITKLNFILSVPRERTP